LRYIFMISEIRIPKLGMTRSDITVVALSRKYGDRVERDEKVAVIETAKVTYEIQAPAAGLVFYLRKVKDRLNTGALLGVIAESPEEFEAFRSGLPAEAAETGPALIGDEEGEEWGLRLSFEGEDQVGTLSRTAAPALPAVNLEGRKILKRIPFIGMRRRIADNLLASLQTGAQLTIFSQTDMTELANFRQQLLLDYPDAGISFVDMLVKILPIVLKEFPLLNSVIAGDEILCWDEYHVAVAVALDEGLVVPVVRDVDKKSLVAVSREIKKVSRKARQNELDPSSYQGGTFTITSGGKVETDFMTPIINPPQNAILGVGKIGPRPAVFQGQMAIRSTAYLCLTHDHRVIDGVPASMFLGRLKEIIEHREIFTKVLK
jgi:pyruvate dehydrogenase E2 component (dihydrolipoamide acetyltransferase)